MGGRCNRMRIYMRVCAGEVEGMRVPHVGTGMRMQLPGRAAPPAKAWERGQNGRCLTRDHIQRYVILTTLALIVGGAISTTKKITAYFYLYEVSTRETIYSYRPVPPDINTQASY